MPLYSKLLLVSLVISQEETELHSAGIQVESHMVTALNVKRQVGCFIHSQMRWPQVVCSPTTSGKQVHRDLAVLVPLVSLPLPCQISILPGKTVMCRRDQDPTQRGQHTKALERQFYYMWSNWVKIVFSLVSWSDSSPSIQKHDFPPSTVLS